MPLSIAQEKTGVVWHGSFFVTHSLALVNRELTLALLNQSEFAARFDLGIEHYEPPTFTAEADPRLVALAERVGQTPANVQLTVRHRWPPEFAKPASGRLALIQPWEFGSLPRRWVREIERAVDEIWIPSHFVRETYLQSGVPAEKVFVVPNGVRTEQFHPNVTPYDFSRNPLTRHITPDTYTFLFVGGTIARKGIDILLDAYDRAFNSRDNVTLIIKDFGTSSFYANQGAVALIRALQVKPGGANIVYLTDDMTEAEIAGLYAACDCLVHPYRGEGYGLPIAEAMACGKPTILTGYGAALDFANETNAYLIPASLETLSERRVGDLATVGDPFWAKPDVEFLRDLLKHVMANREEAARIGAQAAQDIATKHTWEQAASVALERIVNLVERPATAEAAAFALPLGLGNLGFGAGLNLPSITSNTLDAEALGEMYEERKQDAIAATREGNWQKAITELDACLIERPDDWDVVNALAVARYRNGDADSAIALLQQGLKEAPNKRDFHHNLAFILLDSGSPLESLPHALAALEYTPENADIRRLVKRAQEGILPLARKILRRYPDKDRMKAKRDPEYRALMDQYARAGKALKAASIPAPAQRRQDNRLSLCMIVKNEERFLANCLASAKDIVDEIVIVDTGSTDRTIDIAQDFGAKVIHYEWTDDFSAARNISLEHATGNWALWLDADEEIAPESAHLFRQAMDNAPPDIGAFLIMFRNWLTTTSRQEGSEMAVHHACRLFRREPGVFFEGRIHEQNLRSLQQLGYRYAKVEGLIIDHFGYAGEIMSLRNKHERFIRMLHREVEEGPEQFRHFQLFNLGNAYFTAGDMENAVLYLSQAAENPDTAEEYTVSLYIEWIAALHRLGRSAEGLEVFEQADALGIRHAGIQFGRGYCLLHEKRYEEAEMAFRAAIAMGQEDTGIYAKSGDAGLSGYKAQYGLALALVGQDRYADAVPVCEAALQAQANFADARYLYTIVLTRLQRTADAIRELATLLHYDPNHQDAVRDLAIFHFEAKDYAASLPHLRRLVQWNPMHTETLAQLAVCCENLHLLDEARETYERLRLLAPTSPEICVNLGRVLAASGAPAEAIDCFNDAIQLNPKYGNAYFNAGDLLYQLGYYSNAAEAYLAGLEVQPDYAQGFFVLGNCYYQTEDYQAAALAYQQVLIQQPNHPQAGHNLLLAQEHLAEAA
jgi:glycosyltransferase involved in cell wall biosynthesis/Flp pilus assembly protein TadD